ncbi:hypothetical protein K501DRAFT_166325 [Backusella circina FSU 941]|nr:hypothetical protein K501DRAFT_166325 [Backusella circina FSU 941]
MAEIEFEGLPRPNAIFLRGVDEMSTSDIKKYCDSTDLLKVQWINDTSCNLIFDTKEQAEQVTKALVTDPDVEVNHKTLLTAKSFENADGKIIELSLRLATDEDVKSKGSRERSRYYLLHGTEDSEVMREGRSNDVEKRMKQNGGDGRDVFSRLGNKVANNERRGGNQRRQRDRSASPSREVTRKTRELPEHLKSRLGALNNNDIKTEDIKTEEE